MYRHRGNTAANPRSRPQPKPEKQALYIAESIMARRAEGRTYRVEEYGIADNPEMIELVARQLGVIR